MSLILALALVATPAAALPTCSWDRPGVNPFMGDVIAAVDHYQDIPADVRAALKARMSARKYDDVVTITRDGIRGKQQYDSAIRDMHFGAGAVCTSVTRSKWSVKTEERGLVYCEKDQCLVVPTVCRNVSRITRRAGQPGAATAHKGDTAPAPEAMSANLEGRHASTAPAAAEPGDDPAMFDTRMGRGFSPAQYSTVAGGSADRSDGGLGNAGRGGLSDGSSGDWDPSMNPDSPYPHESQVTGGAGNPAPGSGNPVPDHGAGVDPTRPVTSPVPEPATWALLMAGLTLLASLSARARRP